VYERGYCVEQQDRTGEWQILSGKTVVVGNVSRDVTLHFRRLSRIVSRYSSGSSFAWLLLVLQLFCARGPYHCHQHF